MNKLLNHGIVEVATLIPNEVKIANPKFNVDEISNFFEVYKILENINEKNYKAGVYGYDTRNDRIYCPWIWLRDRA